VSDSRDLGAALALGLGGGLRAFAPAVAFAVHGRGRLAGRARFIVFGAAAVELVVDKLPSTPSRWSLRGMSVVAAAAEDALGYSLVLTATSSLH
jgi:hypothetical protein